jgi:hypothetical protein
LDGPQLSFTGGETSIHFNRAIGPDGYLLKTTRPQIESDVNYLHADVSSLKVLEKAKGKSRMIILPETSAA